MQIVQLNEHLKPIDWYMVNMVGVLHDWIKRCVCVCAAVAKYFGYSQVNKHCCMATVLVHMLASCAQAYLIMAYGDGTNQLQVL